MMLSLVVVAGAADPVTTGQVTLKVELQGQLEEQLGAPTLTYRVYLQPQGDAKIGAAQFELTSPDGATFLDFDVNPALVYTVKPGVKYGSDQGIFELDKLTTNLTTGSMGGTIKNDGKTLSAILAGTDPSEASRMMTSAQSEVYVYQITLSVPGGVKKNVDYTLTVGANPAVGYDDNGTVSTKYRHTVTVVNPQVKCSTVQLGDINGDGYVDAGDRIILVRYLAKWSAYKNQIVEGENSFLAADINDDGYVDAGDRIILIRYLAKWHQYDHYFQ